MSGNRSSWLGVAAMVAMIAMAGVLGGCQEQKRMAEERDALRSQNIEAQNELNRTRAALEAAENDRNTTAAELERLRAELAAAEARAAAARTSQRPEGGVIVHQTRAPGAADKSFSDLGPGVEVERGKGRITVRIPGDVLFAPGKAELNTAVKATLAKVAKTLNGAERAHPVRVEGYTDADPIKHSKWKSNQELSEARAGAVAKYLESQGVAATRVTTVGYGAAKPQATKALSRRVEIVVLTAK